MFRSLLSFLLIVTIVTCPLWCRLGLCHADGDCCAVEAVCVKAAPVNQQPGGCDSCCCGHTATGETGGGSSEAPGPDVPDAPPCPNDSCNDTCQGICGGALSCRDNDRLTDDNSWLPTFDLPSAMFAVSYGPQQLGRPLPQPDHPRAGKNLGRSLRAWHMSWVC